MNDDTKKLLLSICQTLRQVTDSAYHAQEMAWRTYAALAQLGPPNFVDEYAHPKVLSVDEIIGLRERLLETLDKAILQLQK